MTAPVLAALFSVGLAGPARAQAPAASAAAEVPAADVDAAQPLSEPPLFAAPTDPAAIERTTNEISSGLRCPVCQGLSVNDSPAEGARAMKARIHELVLMGYSQQQIEDYFVDRYGTWVLLAPPATGQHWAVYVAPIVFLVGGAGLIALFLRGRQGVAAAAPAPSAATSAPSAPASLAADQDDELEPYRRRILAELGHHSPEGAP